MFRNGENSIKFYNGSDIISASDLEDSELFIANRKPAESRVSRAQSEGRYSYTRFNNMQPDSYAESQPVNYSYAHPERQYEENSFPENNARFSGFVPEPVPSYENRKVYYTVNPVDLLSEDKSFVRVKEEPEFSLNDEMIKELDDIFSSFVNETETPRYSTEEEINAAFSQITVEDAIYKEEPAAKEEIVPEEIKTEPEHLSLNDLIDRFNSEFSDFYKSVSAEDEKPAFSKETVSPVKTASFDVTNKDVMSKSQERYIEPQIFNNPVDFMSKLVKVVKK